MNGHTLPAPATAAIAGHPVHPMLIAFPIAFLTAAFLTDLLARRGESGFWSRASLWLTGAGLATGLAAAVPGAVDFFTIPRAREHLDGWIHSLGNGVVLALAAASFVLRRRFRGPGVPPAALAISAVVAGLLVVTGWYGGELTYRHLIGVSGHAGAPRASAPDGDNRGAAAGRAPAGHSH